MIFPNGAKAALAISNDAEYMTWDCFLRTNRFFSGVLGVPISNSLFFWHGRRTGAFSYFSPQSCDQSTVRAAVEAGHIDTLHAYGDFDTGTFTRSYARTVEETCRDDGMTFPVWTNHGNSLNYQNVGHERLYTYQEGDDPDAQSDDYMGYHLDCARRIGVRYYWVDDGLQPAPGVGSIAYSERFRDGTDGTFFRRYRGLVGQKAPTVSSLGEQLTPDDIAGLITIEGACILYQHLGAVRNVDGTCRPCEGPHEFDGPALSTLMAIADAHGRKSLWVTTVSRLLDWITFGVDRGPLPEWRW